MNYSMLINKQHAITKDYSSEELVEVDSKYKDGIMLEKKAYSHWLKLKNAVSKKGYQIEIESGYRSHEYQSKIMDNLIKEKGEYYAYNAVAIPGHSEHQTGLALDYCIMKDNEFVTEKDMDIMEECIYTNSRAHIHGFIVRYPKGKEAITGYMYEPWHLRYVGKKIATYLYKNNLTLEEYYKC